MTREDLFAHILSGADWEHEHVFALEKNGFVKIIVAERYRVVKPFMYVSAMARPGDTLMLSPKTAIAPATMLLRQGAVQRDGSRHIDIVKSP